MNLLTTISTSLIAIFLAFTIGCSGNANRESTGEYFDDTWITTKVKAALVDDPVVRAREVNVETFKGVVQLSGFVRSKEAMDQAVAIARSIEGVKDVKSDMRVK